jgi:hypothetical protein
LSSCSNGHRIRGIDADTVLLTFRRSAIKVAEGVAEAACAHIAALSLNQGLEKFTRVVAKRAR